MILSKEIQVKNLIFYIVTRKIFKNQSKELTDFKTETHTRSELK